MSNKKITIEDEEKLKRYSGKWIAVVKGKIVASGESVKEVMRKIKERGIKELPLVRKVPRKEEGYYILIWIIHQ